MENKKRLTTKAGETMGEVIIKDKTNEIVESVASITKTYIGKYRIEDIREEHRFRFYTYEIKLNKKINLFDDESIISHNTKRTIYGYTIHYVIYSNGIVHFYVTCENDNTKWSSNLETFYENVHDISIYPATIGNMRLHITEELQRKLYNC